VTTAHTAYALFRNALVARKDIFVQAAAASLLANLLALAAALYSMQVYDRVIPTQGISTLLVLTVGVLIAIVLELIVKFARAHVLESGVKGMDLELSDAIFARLLGIRMDQFPASVGTLSAQLRSYEMIRRFASSATLYLVVDTPFALIFLAVIALLAGAKMAAIPVVFFALALAIGLLYRQRIARHAESGNAAANHKLGLLVETVESAESIKAAGAGTRQLERWNTLSRQAVDDDVQIQRYSEQATYLAAFMQQASYILLVAIGAWIASTSSDLTMGGLIACAILSGRVLGPIAALPGLIVQWAHARSALDSLEKVFALQGDNHAVARPLSPELIHGEWRIENLKFAYPGRPRPLSLPLTLIRPGEKVAIIGPIGAGKSTLLKLMAGLFAPGEGQVLLDGLDIQQIDRAHLSARLGYLPQDVKLLAGSLRDNLMVGLGDVNETALLDASRGIGLDQLIASHPQGLDMPIFEGGKGVSGGQKQLIALTRLLLSRPAAWLLDEPTAAMDEATEQKSLAALRQAIAPEHTLILVTHKPVLLGLVDRFIVLLPGGGVIDGPKAAVLDRLRQSAAQARASGAVQTDAHPDAHPGNPEETP
jgi:ATP-binding cassette subfamily C protein LapB